MSGSLLEEHAVSSFARHETFHPRFGWLKKAAVEVEECPALFLEPNATVILGVGKNMVSAIRYWAQAFQVIRPKVTENAKTRKMEYELTDFARELLDEDGLDPWLEDTGSLWLLHWKLLQRVEGHKCQAPTWWVAFNAFPPIQFAENLLATTVVELSGAAGWSSVSEGSVKKDIDCFLKMYAHGRQGTSLDDYLDCPFRELGLVEPVPGERSTWRFSVGEKATLPDAIVLYAALQYLQSQGSQSASMARLASDPGSPGAVFKLHEVALHAALVRSCTGVEGVEVAEPGGLRQLVVSAESSLTAVAQQVLHSYFHPHTTKGCVA